jgi:hypothetical protein
MTGATIELDFNVTDGTDGTEYVVLNSLEDTLLVLRRKETGAMFARAWAWGHYANGSWADPRGPLEALVSVKVRDLLCLTGPFIAATVEEMERFLAEVAGLVDGTVDDADVYGAVEALAERYDFGNFDYDDYVACGLIEEEEEAS